MQHAKGLVAITALSGAAVATVAWRARGVLHVTAVVKATFAIVPGASMSLVAPDPIERDEQEGAPGEGMRAAGDLAPYLAEVDVLLLGHAHAAPSAPEVTAGFALARDGVALLEKGLELEVPRDALLSRGASAAGQRSPSGAHLTVQIPLGGMGPLSRRWPVRARLLEGLDPRALEEPIAAIPEPFNWSYFQAAPLDQRMSALQGDEWLLLGSMHPEHAEVASRLPGAWGVARLYGKAPGLRGRSIPLTADTLCIDVDRQRCSMLWRGHFPVSSERELSSLHIVAGVELPGRALTWVDPFPLAGALERRPSSAPPPVPSPWEPTGSSARALPPMAPPSPFTQAPALSSPLDLAGTAALSDEEARKLSTAQATPFKPSALPPIAWVPSAPSSKLDAAPSLSHLPFSPPPKPAPTAGAPPTSAPSSLEGTVAISREDAEKLRAMQATSPKQKSAPPVPEPPEELFGTVALGDEDAKKLSAVKATPFKPSPLPAVGRVPDLPASKLRPLAPPKSSAGASLPQAPDALFGTMALSDEEAARLKSGKTTPFEARGAPIPAATSRPPAPPPSVPLAAAAGAAPPPPAPLTAAASAAPPKTLGEHFLAAMASANVTPG